MALDQGTNVYTDGCDPNGRHNWTSPPVTGKLIIAGDGYAYLLYDYLEEFQADVNVGGLCNSTGNFQEHLRLLLVGPDGTSQKIALADWSEPFSATDYWADESHTSTYQVWTQSGALPEGTVVNSSSVVTNADSGVTLALNYSVYGYCSQYTIPSGPSSGCVPEENDHRLVVVSGGSLVSDSAINMAAPQHDFGPILQAEDGTYFGTGVSSQYSMDAFDLSGNVKWSVPNFTPVMATADGGVIARGSSGYVTFDQNGVANGMLPNMPTLSWKGAYQLGSAESVVPSFDLAATIATSYAAVPGGNLTGNGFSLAHHTFGLVFCGPEGDGTCPSNLSLTNVTFSYLQGINNTNCGQACDFTQSSPCDYSTAHPEWVAAIKNAALNTYVAAFAHLPAIVFNHYSPVMLNAGSNNPPFQHTVYIDGSWTSSGICPNPGFTPSDETGATTSYVYYLAHMCNAQHLTGNSPPITDTINMQKLVTAIGTGIGNTAAHETGHQIDFSPFPPHYMDCGNSDMNPCPDNNNSVYEYFADTYATYGDDPQNPIRWIPINNCILAEYLFTRNLGCK